MSCYKGDKPNELKDAINSIFRSTIVPDEFILVTDGPIDSELEKVVSSAVKKYPSIKRIPIENNVGLGNALRIGLNYCSHNLVARMDADDINLPDRFEQQIQVFNKNSKVTVCGMQIEEFGDNDTRRFIRKVPLTSKDIKKYSKLRNPFNHVTIMFNKEKILKVGSYEQVPFFEDYFLWIKCLNANYKVLNLNIVGVKVRAGLDMTFRRKGIDYIKHEVYFFKKAMELKYINKYEFILALFLRTPPRLLGGFFLKFYKKILRKEIKT